MDLRDFFETVPFSLAETKMLASGVPARVVDYIRKYLLHEGRCSQGSPLSPYLANIALSEFDRAMVAFAKKHKLVYSRYADDIVLTPDLLATSTLSKINFTKGKIQSIVLAVEALLDKLTNGCCKLNRKKTRCCWRNGRASQRITGVVLRQDALGYNAPKKYRKKIRAKCHNLYKEVRDGVAAGHERDWLSLKGSVQFLDWVRQHSNAGDAAGKDCVINNKEYIFLEKLFSGKGTREVVP